MPALRSLILVLSLVPPSLYAAITPLAITGDSVPGLPSATLATVGDAQLNTLGQGVFAASLQTGAGGITAETASVFLAFDGPLSLLAQSGIANVAGAPDTHYATFRQFKVDDSGDVVLQATLTETGTSTGTNRQGYWRFSGGVPQMLARTGTSTPPGAPGTKFKDLGARIGNAPTGDFAFLGQLDLDISANVTTLNDAGLWSFQGTTGTLIAREDAAAYGVPGALFAAFGHPAFNSSNQLAARTMLKHNSFINVTNQTGVWLYADGGGTVLARIGSGNVPGHAGDFTAFSDPVINEAGQVAFRADLSTGEQGLWLYSGDAGTNLALGSAGGVPGVPAADFATFSKPLLTPAGQVVASATLTAGVGEVTSANDSGLWRFDTTAGQLLAREGVEGVADVPGASFASFQYFAPVADAAVYVQATLQPSAGIVDATNDQGIWHIPFSGTPALIVRKGDTLAGRTIVDLSLPTSEELGSQVHGVSNADGDLLFRATFANGDSGLFLYSAESEAEFAAADFNLDGFVNAADLTTWQNAYGQSTAGDADNDGDTDGADFLIWQRQHTGPDAALQGLAVPEPGVVMLLAAAGLCVSAGYRRQRLELR